MRPAVPGRSSGRVALVHGGSSGIGTAAVWSLCRDGAAVAFTGVDQHQATELESRLREQGHDAWGLGLDVRNRAQIKYVTDQVVERYGGLDILVYSAGIQRYGTVRSTPEDVWDEVFDVNLKGAYLAAQAAIGPMLDRGGGSIVLVSSVQASATQKNVAAYTASKAGMLGLMRTMAIDFAADGIRTNVISPASVDTPMLRASARQVAGSNDGEDKVVAEWGAMHPPGRVALASEVGEVIAFLASQQASYVNGLDMRVDGGLLAALPLVAP